MNYGEEQAQYFNNLDEGYLGDGVYADWLADGTVVLRAPLDNRLNIIELSPTTKAALDQFIERKRRAMAEFELLADRVELSFTE